jgi:hypothetical protein
MKYIKKFEKEIINPYLLDALEYFFNQYNIFKKSGGKRTYIQDIISMAKSYKIPEIFHHEFCILYFLYEYRGWWNKTDNSSLGDFIKKEIKKQMLDSIIKKFNDDTNNYYLLKDIFDKRPGWNNRRSLSSINQGVVKYIFMLFDKSINNAPQWIKDSNKYNL